MGRVALPLTPPYVVRLSIPTAGHTVASGLTYINPETVFIAEPPDAPPKISSGINDIRYVKKDGSLIIRIVEHIFLSTFINAEMCTIKVPLKSKNIEIKTPFLHKKSKKEIFKLNHTLKQLSL